MKKSVFTLMALLACTIYPVQAYEYFTIYFSDGTKSEAFYATDVDSICYSKLSLDSIAYDDWQVQEIYTCDSVYRYPLAQIDSLIFKDIDINKVAEDIATIGNAVSSIYSQCNSTEDIYTHFSEILSISGVDDVWTDNQSLFVKIKDFGTVSYLYPPQDIPVTESLTDGSSISFSPVHTIRRATLEDIVPDHDRTDAKSICIVNQQSKDQTRGNKIYVSTELDKYCSSLGMSVKIEPHPLPSFFESEIYNYDIVILMTHGNYDEVHGLHWLATSDELCVIKKHETIDKNTVADILINRGYYNRYSTRDISYTCIPEVRNGDTCQVYYAQISNLFISKQKNKRFRNYGNVIIFNTACQSLKGSQVDAYNLAYAFGQKGARSYLGYNEADKIGTGASLLYMLRLLNGQSTEQAFKTLPNEWKEETFEYPEKSGEMVNPKLEHIHSTNYGIISPKTLSVEFDNEKVKIMGSMKILNPYGEEASKNEYGLKYSQSPSMDDCKVTECELNYDEQTHDVIMDYTFKGGELIAGTTYYYCAYMYDGYSNCYGEIKSFTTPDENAEAYGVLSENGTFLTYYYDGKKNEREGQIVTVPYNYSQSIEIVSFDASFVKYKPTSTRYWFSGMSNLTSIQNIENLNTSEVTDMSAMFSGCSSLEELDLSCFDTSKVKDMRGMFNDCTTLKELNISNFIISDNVISKNDFGTCFNELLGTCPLENIILNNACIKGEGGASLFAGLTALKNLELSNVDTSESTNMDRMFAWCSSLQDINLNSFNTNDVSNMREMFLGCTSLKNLNLGTFNTSKVNDMSMMFAGCDSLRSLDLSNFNTFNVANMREMFLSKSLENLNIKNFVFNNANWPFGSHGGCPSLVSIDLSNGKAIGKGAEGLFFSLSSLKKVNLDNFDTSEAVNLSCMFCGCSSLTILDLSSFNVSKVNDVTGIFSGCHSLTKIYAGNWYNDINNDYPNHGGFSGDTLIFTDCKNLVGGQGTKVGENYFKGDDGETGIYHCYGSVWDAHIDGGKENPGLFTAK